MDIKKLLNDLKLEKGLTQEAIDAELNKVVVEKNANEVEHTTNTGYGAELVPVNVLSDKLLNVIPMYAKLMDALSSGFHGNQMGASVKVAIKGEVGFAQSNAEWTTGAGLIAQGKNRLATGEVTITQYPMIASVDISKKLMNHSIVDLESYIIAEIAKSYARTMESQVINGDTTTGGTGNVNSDDQAPATTFATTGGAADHRILMNGLRQTAIAGTIDVDKYDVGSMTWDDIIAVRSLMGDYSYDLEELLLIMNGRTYNKALTLDEFKKANENGKDSTITTGAKTNISGVDLFVARDFGLTEADGKMSATPASNTKGGFIYLRKSAVQRGFGQELEIDVVKIPGKGISIIGTMEFGFAIVNKKAGVTDPAVVLGFNATV